MKQLEIKFIYLGIVHDATQDFGISHYTKMKLAKIDDFQNIWFIIIVIFSCLPQMFERIVHDFFN